MAKPKGFNVACWLGIISYALLFLAGWASALWSILKTAVGSFSLITPMKDPLEILFLDESILALTYIIGLYQIHLLVRMLKSRSDEVRSFQICLGVSVGLAWCNSLWVLFVIPQEEAQYVHINTALLTVLSCSLGLYFTRPPVKAYLNA